MLVLSRKVKQRVLIGPSTIVEILGIHGGQVSLGIDAPGQPIWREELKRRLVGRQIRNPKLR